MLQTSVGVYAGTRFHIDLLVDTNHLGKLSLENTSDFSDV